MKLFQKSKPDFEKAYINYADMLYRIAVAYLKNSEDASDAVQDVFIKLMDKAPSFKDENHEKAYLLRLTVNRCKDILRKKSIRLHSSIEEAYEVASHSDTDISDMLTLLHSIDEKYRETLILHYLEGLSAEETAEALGISLSAVKMRLMRGREILRNAMEKEE